MDKDEVLYGPEALLELKKLGMNYVVVVTSPQFMPFEIFHLVGMEHPPQERDFVRIEEVMKTDPMLMHLAHLRPLYDYELGSAKIDDILADMGISQ